MAERPAAPWHVYDEEPDEFEVRGESGPGWYENVAEGIPNRETAILIAAAPDLLAALEGAVQRFCDHICESKWKTAVGRQHDPQCIANHAAIAKATP